MALQFHCAPLGGGDVEETELQEKQCDDVIDIGTWVDLLEMASLLQPDRVLYLVRGEKKIRSSLSQLYFCRYCSELRSLECVSHEVSRTSPRHTSFVASWIASFRSHLTLASQL